MLVSEGEIAYGAWRAYMNQRPERYNFVTWAELDSWIQEGWQHAASEAISVHVAACLA